MKLIALTTCGVDYYPQNDLSMTGGSSMKSASEAASKEVQIWGGPASLFKESQEGQYE